MADKKFFKYLDDDGRERLRFKVITLKGKVIDIVIQYETFVDNKWVPVVRYDCAHGFFHRDIMNPDGSQSKESISINRLEVAIDYAEQELKDNWHNYRNNYLKKLND